MFMNHCYKCSFRAPRKPTVRYIWTYATSSFCETSAVVYDFSSNRADEHARNLLQDWTGELVCDYFGEYKARFALSMMQIGYMAHSRCMFFELQAND